MAIPTESPDFTQPEEPTAFTVRAWFFLAALLAVVSLVSGLYTSSHRDPPPLFQLLGWLCVGIAFAHLIARDRPRFGLRTWPTDFALLILVAWPVVVPYHLFSTRGRAGWRPFLVFVALYIGQSVLLYGPSFLTWFFTGRS